MVQDNLPDGCISKFLPFVAMAIYFDDVMKNNRLFSQTFFEDNIL